MADAKDFVRIAKSARPPIPGSQEMGDVDPEEVIDVTVRLRPRAPLSELSQQVHAMAARPAHERQHLSREQFAQSHGARPEDMEKVKAFAGEHGLTVTDANLGRRSVHLVGTAREMSQAFQTGVKHYRHGQLVYRAHTDHLHVPADLADSVEAVFGFDTRPFARPHYRIAQKSTGVAAHAAHAARAFHPNELAQVYQFPPQADGTGQVVGIIELGSPHGSGYRAAELKKYFASIKVGNPKVVAVSVDGGRNKPGSDPTDPQNADGEVMLDIEVVGAIAPKAKLVVYFAPNTAQGFVDVINRAVHDSDNNPSVISLSWGSAENPDDATTDQINQILQAAASMGVTFCVASGDSGSRDDPNDPGHASVDFPASSPYALGCGGTHLEVTGTAISNEVVWEQHSGGGVSRIFDLPSYQSQAKVPPAKNPAGPVKRGVPDVAGDADPATGYEILVDGQSLTFGGTSAVAPLWAGLVARLNQVLGHPVGFLNPILYNHPEVFHDITSGSNIDYQAGAGWDPCTGLGSPNGVKLLAVLSAPASGVAHAGVAAGATS
jgi:kumamolisin